MLVDRDSMLERQAFGPDQLSCLLQFLLDAFFGAPTRDSTRGYSSVEITTAVKVGDETQTDDDII